MIKDEWYKKHKCCPQCGSEKIEQSLMAPVCDENNYDDHINTAKCCECGWKGMVKNLVPSKEDSRTIKVELRTMDKDNDVYVSCWDLVGALKAYQANVLTLVQDKDAQQYTNSLFEEIYKTIISADYQHRVLKEKELQKAAESAESAETEINKEEK